MEILDRNRITRAKFAFSTRRVPHDAIKTLLVSGHKPKSGDLVLARVTALGSHTRIELPTGRRASLFRGDEIVLAYGNRYAPDQYEAYIPKTLAPCHMVAAGGVAAQATTWHDRLTGPTEIEPIGLLGCAKRKPLNLADFAVPAIPAPIESQVFAVFGTSMNAGKTATAAALVKGLTEAGHRVGAAKITGTGAGGDLWLMRDSGAVAAFDFTDAGFPSTFDVSPDAILAGATNLVRALSREGCSTIVLEVADGLYQSETDALARSAEFRSLLSGTFFAAGDAMGAVAGIAHLSALGHDVRGLSGALTRSPLAMREAGASTAVPLFTLADLMNPDTVQGWISQTSPDLACA